VRISTELAVFLGKSMYSIVESFIDSVIKLLIMPDNSIHAYDVNRSAIISQSNARTNNYLHCYQIQGVKFHFHLFYIRFVTNLSVSSRYAVLRQLRLVT